MTFEELESLVTDMQKRVDDIQHIDFKNITEFDQLPALDFDDSLIAVTSSDYTGKVTIEQIMEYLNKNLKNFICWKPVVNESTLSWERSSNDESPASIKFSDILFPMASETDNGMMASEDYIKLASIRSDNIVYDDVLTETLQSYALKIHVHDQYQLKSEMPTLVSAFDNDAKYITIDDVPKKLSSFENDISFATLDDIPTVSSSQAGLMTPELLKIVSDIVDTYVTTDALTDILNRAIPTVVSAFTNDADYMPRSQIFNTFGNLGVINIVRNSDFLFDEYDDAEKATVIAGWKIDNGSMERYTDDPDYSSVGKVTFSDGTILKAQLISSTAPTNTISFLARSESSAKFMIEVGDGSGTIDIGTTWRLYNLTINDNGSNPSMYIQFKLNDDNVSSTTLYITHVKMEYGNLSSEYYPSYVDLLDLIKIPASLTEYGAVIPDGDTIGINTAGKLTVLPKALNTLRIDDDNASLNTVYSSSKIEGRLSTKVPIEDGKIPAKYLPSYVDDTIEGIMDIDSEGNYVFIADEGQYGPSEPSKGIIYVDTNTNLLYRWTGSIYVCIGGREDDVASMNKISRKDITITENTSNIDIPSSITATTGLTVYYNGLLLTKDINYTISESVITAIDFEFTKDSIVTILSNVVESNMPASGISLDNSDAYFGGNSNVQSGMEYLSNSILALQANKTISVVGTLLSTEWSDNTQTLKVDKVTTSNTVIICPAPESRLAYGKYNIACISQGENELTYTCDKTPDVDIIVNIVIICQ